MQKFHYVGKLLLLFLILVSCSQRGKVTKSKLILNLGNQTSGAHRLTANNKVITHLVVNVTGPSMPNRLFYSWDACKSNNCTNAALPEITFDVPTGADRLIQVLAVFSTDGNSQSMDFYYGDALRTLSKSNEDISVTISALYNTSSTVRSGRIAGRYQNSDGSYSTGKVSIEYQPPGNKPAMQITKAEIFNGWFEFFSLDSVSLNYVLENGQVIFSNTTLNHTNLSASEKVIQVSLPDYWSVYKYLPNGSTGTMSGSSWQNSDSDDLAIFGYFGLSSSSVVCYNNNEAAVKNSVILNATGTPVSINGYYKNEAATDPLLWRNSYDSSNLSRIGGGVALNDTRCSVTATPFVNVFTIDYKNFEGNSSALAGFSGPFRLIPGTPNSSNNPAYVKIYVTPVADANNYIPTQVKWDYLPSVFSSDGISGVTVFQKTYPTGINMNTIRESIQDENGFRCNHLTGFGFSEVSTTPDSSGLIKSANLSGLTSSSLSTTAVVICPYKSDFFGGKSYYSSSLFTDLRQAASQFSSLAGSVSASPSVSNNSNVTVGGYVTIHFDQPIDTLNTTIAGLANGDTVTWINNNQEVVITFNSAGSRTVVITGVGAVSGTLAPMTYQYSVTNPATLSSVVPYYGTAAVHWNDYIKNSGTNMFNATPIPCDKTLFENRFNSCIHAGIMRSFTLSNPPSGFNCSDAYIEDISSSNDPFKDNVFDWKCSQAGGTTRFYSYQLMEGAGLNNLISYNGGSYSFDYRHIEVSTFDINGNPTPIATSVPSIWWTDSVLPMPGNYILNASNTVYVTNNDYILTTETVKLTSDKVSLTFDTFSNEPYAIIKSNFLGNSATPNAITVENASFTWVEGLVVATPGATTVNAESKVVALNNSHFSQIRSLFVETDDAFPANSLSIIGSSHNLVIDSNVSNYSQTPTNTGIKVEANILGTPSLFNTFYRISTSNNYDGIVINNPYNLLMDVNSTNNINDGVVLNEKNNILINILSSNNGQNGIWIEGANGNSNEGNLVMNATLNQNYYGLKMGSYTGYTTAENILIYNNRGNGLQAEAFYSKLNSFYNLSIGANLGTYQIELGSTASTPSQNYFSGVLNVAPTNAPDPICHVPASGIHGLVPDCSLNGASDAYDDILLSMDLFDYAFAGIAPGATAQIPSGVPWGYYGENRHYTWISATPGYNGRCEWDHECIMNDLRLNATPPTSGIQIALDNNSFPSDTSDIKVHYWGTASNDVATCIFPGATTLSDICNYPGYSDNTSCTSAVGGTWGTPTCVTITLRNAYEILQDGVGNENGVCESNENCVHSPNIGTYQGEKYSYLTSVVLPTSTANSLVGIELTEPSINGATPAIAPF